MFGRRRVGSAPGGGAAVAASSTVANSRAACQEPQRLVAEINLAIESSDSQPRATSQVRPAPTVWPEVGR
jgi:hypothetical protein